MRATRLSVFVEAIIITLVSFNETWAMTAGVIGIALTLLAMARAPKLIPVPRDDHLLYVRQADHEFRHNIDPAFTTLPDLYRIER